ncbi:class I SAM-dependent methyltransferase [Paenibacillus durus]|uniref:Methyltransferase type 11 domain-containing protein n=1 Tax=Paenibacillus durus ATCC 35681 TaxID=1333534 RepID=A0A0F7F7Y3_PAEDU|nr:class I SAM-dependent methyltransferase [Paenibacillus durus]AKG34324.1 hypothetical protein VK70_06845 [Paenibacillus durus ATCC 35681]
MKLNPSQIKEFYESQESIWPEDDNWHLHTKKEIEKYIASKHNIFIDNPHILNAGSGGNTYGLKYDMHHLDITDKFISKFAKYSVASVENMPFAASSFDIAICVGSVINYCDASICISELSRILKPGGYLLLEFESSWSIDFFNSDAYKESAAVIKTKYFNEEHILWVYSMNYITEILKSCGLQSLQTKRFHILSNFFYKLLKNENSATKFAIADSLFQYIPFLAHRSHNIIMLCRKH